MEEHSFKVIVPASSANFGPGFDCIGLAINRYLRIKVTHWETSEIEENQVAIIDYISKYSDEIPPLDKENLIFQVASMVISQMSQMTLKLLKMSIENEIPLSRGMGSSSSAVIGGILIAKKILKLEWSNKDILSIALKFESHADNMTPTVVGGFTKSVVIGQKVCFVNLPFNEELLLAMFIPLNYKLSTDLARKALPKIMDLEAVVFNMQRASVIGDLLSRPQEHQEDIYECLKDKIHQPFRQTLVPGLEKVISIPFQLGYLGSYLSGAGPTVCSLVLRRDHPILENILAIFSALKIEIELAIVNVVNNGARIE